MVTAFVFCGHSLQGLHKKADEYSAKIYINSDQ